MKTYIPTKKELREMGFDNRSGTGNFKKTTKEDMIFFYAKGSINPWQFHIPRMGVGANWYTFFPRSREHLESIILAFTKPE